MKTQILLILGNLFVTSLFGQIIVTSKLIDQTTKKPIANANVYLLRNRLTGTSSSNSGNFKLEVQETSKNDKLVITCVGYEKKEVTINYAIRNMEIELIPKVEQLDEVIIKQNFSVKSIVKIALRKYPKRYYKRDYSTDFIIKNYIFVDSTKQVVGAMKASGLMYKFDFYNDSIDDKIKINQYQFFGEIDTSYFTPFMLIKNSLINDSRSKDLKIEYRIIDHYKCFWHINPVILSEAYLPNMQGHFNFILDTNNANNHWVINAINPRQINYDFKLPEDQFRKKHRKDLEAFKEKVNYSPSNKFFVYSENKIDSLFYLNLRKSMEKGTFLVFNMILYIDKSTFSIQKTEYRITSTDLEGNAISFTNFTATYTYLAKQKKNILSKLQIASKSNKSKLNTYTSIDFTNIKTGKEVDRINSKVVFDMKKPNIPSIDLINIDIEDWNRVKDTDILKPILRQNN